jgi:PhzF family phenazine biosynthesis protein
MVVRSYKQVDVFTHTPYLGNPLAVVMDGTGLNTAQMQHFAHWTNLSETVFLLPPTQAGADYQARIFTPGTELPFAGHPTLGSCHAWLESGGRPRNPDMVVMQCQVGLVRIRRTNARLAFAAPPLRRSMPDAQVLSKVLAALGLSPHQVVAAQVLDNGPVWLGLLLDSADTVLAITPKLPELVGLAEGIGVAAPSLPRHSSPLIARSNREARAFGNPSPSAHSMPQPDMEVRFFAPDLSMGEDPVTGSFNASLAQWLIADGHAPRHYTATQGSSLGRAGYIHIEQDAAGQVWVGGDSVTCIDGHVTL